MAAKPGSDEAIDAGCTCAVIDNGHGKGMSGPGGGKLWWITGGCPLHDKRPADEG